MNADCSFPENHRKAEALAQRILNLPQKEVDYILWLIQLCPNPGRFSKEYRRMIQQKGFSKEALDTVADLANTSTEQLDRLRGHLLEVLVCKASPLLFRPRADVIKRTCCHFKGCPHEIDILCLIHDHPVEMTECKVSIETLYDPPQNYAIRAVHLWENAKCLRKINPGILLLVACLNSRLQAKYFYGILKGQVLVTDDKEIASLFSVVGREDVVDFLFS